LLDAGARQDAVVKKLLQTGRDKIIPIVLARLFHAEATAGSVAEARVPLPPTRRSAQVCFQSRLPNVPLRRISAGPHARHLR